MLLLDGHPSHVSVDLLPFAIRKGILLFKIMPNGTQVWQPVDNCRINGTIERKYTEAIMALHEKSMSVSGMALTITRAIAVREMVNAFNEVSDKAVRRAFEATGFSIPFKRGTFLQVSSNEWHYMCVALTKLMFHVSQSQMLNRH